MKKGTFCSECGITLNEAIKQGMNITYYDYGLYFCSACLAEINEDNNYSYDLGMEELSNNESNRV